MYADGPRLPFGQISHGSAAAHGSAEAAQAHAAGGGLPGLEQVPQSPAGARTCPYRVADAGLLPGRHLALPGSRRCPLPQGAIRRLHITAIAIPLLHPPCIEETSSSDCQMEQCNKLNSNVTGWRLLPEEYRVSALEESCRGSMA